MAITSKFNAFHRLIFRPICAYAFTGFVGLLGLQAPEASAQKNFNKVDGPTLHFIKSGGKCTFQASPIKVVNGKSDFLLEAMPYFIDSLTKVNTNAHRITSGMATLAASPDEVSRMLANPGIIRLTASRKASPVMYEQRVSTGAESVQTGTWLPRAYSGRNVVIGTIDIGFDFTHPAFLDSAGNQTRILQVWDQLKRIGTPPAGFNYGSHYRLESQILQAQHDTVGLEETHGSHTAGISGAGYASSVNGSFRGIAPNANIIMVSSDFTNAHVLDACRYIQEAARSQGKPSVINMSFGGWGGPYNGSSAFDRALDALITPGHLIVAAMGNEGKLSFHREVQASSADTIRATFDFKGSSRLVADGRYLEVFAKDSTVLFCEAGILLPGNQFKAIGQPINTRSLVADTLRYSIGNDSVLFVRNTVVGHNQTPSGVQFEYYATSGLAAQPALKIWSTQPARVDVYGIIANIIPGYDSTISSTPYIKGDTTGTFRSPGGTCSRIISVGAHIDKISTFELSGVVNTNPTIQLNTFAKFSSRGPRPDGMQKPTLTAPGVLVASAYNSFYTTPFNLAQVGEGITVRNGRNYYYAALTGTSMSSPMVAGGVALLLEAGLRDPIEIRTLLEQTAQNDVYTNLVDVNRYNRWGAGKLNIYNAIVRDLNAVTPKRAANRLIIHKKGVDAVSVTNEMGTPFVLEVFDFAGRRIYQGRKSDQHTLYLTSSYQILILRGQAEKESYFLKWVNF